MPIWVIPFQQAKLTRPRTGAQNNRASHIFLVITDPKDIALFKYRNHAIDAHDVSHKGIHKNAINLSP
jgi:hypothetical protein